MEIRAMMEVALLNTFLTLENTWLVHLRKKTWERLDVDVCSSALDDDDEEDDDDEKSFTRNVRVFN